MKMSYFLAIGIGALCVVQSASADVTVRITGSTAFRSATTNAIKNILSSGNPQIAYNSGSFSSASLSKFVGTLPGVTGTVTVKCAWSGSVAGIRDVAQSNSITFLSDAAVGSTGAGSVSTSTASEIPDIAMADNLQGSTSFKTPNIQTVAQVGIIPFAFVAGKDTLPSVQNITFQMHRALVSRGSVPTSVFSNNPVETRPIYAAGRDPFSGTRLTTLAEDQYGTLVPVTQFKPFSFVPGSPNTVNQIDIYPATALVPDAGNDGETSGGTVANYMRMTTTAIDDVFNGYTGPASFIGYMGESDSYNAVWGVGTSLTGADQGNARYLTFNGVAGYGGQAKRAPSSGSTISINSGSPIVQLASGASFDTSGLVVGQIVTATGIAPGSKIINIDTVNNRVTLDKNATVTNAALGGWLIGSLLPEQIRNGAYTFWNYEYIMWKTGTPAANNNIVGISGDKFTTAVAVRDRIKNFDYGFSGIADDASMKAKRDGDGSFVYPK